MLISEKKLVPVIVQMMRHFWDFSETYAEGIVKRDLSQHRFETKTKIFFAVRNAEQLRGLRFTEFHTYAVFDWNDEFAAAYEEAVRRSHTEILIEMGNPAT